MARNANIISFDEIQQATRERAAATDENRAHKSMRVARPSRFSQSTSFDRRRTPRATFSSSTHAPTQTDVPFDASLDAPFDASLRTGICKTQKTRTTARVQARRTARFTPTERTIFTERVPSKRVLSKPLPTKRSKKTAHFDALSSVLTQATDDYSEPLTEHYTAQPKDLHAEQNRLHTDQNRKHAGQNRLHAEQNELHADQNRQHASQNKRTNRRKQRTKARAEKLFAAQYADDAPSSSDLPRAAVYTGNMGARQRKASRMQRALDASPARAKLIPSTWFARFKASRRALVALTFATCLVLICAFLYTPAQQYYVSVRENQKLSAEYEAIEARNARIEAQNETLSSPAGIEAEAHERYGWIKKDEQTATVVGLSSEAEASSSSSYSSLATKDGEDVLGMQAIYDAQAPETWYTPLLDFIFGVS